MADISFWKERVKQYRHIGWCYPCTYGFDQALRMKVVEKLIGQFSAETNALLDLGCGTGDFSWALKDKFQELVLYDPCAEVLENRKLRGRTAAGMALCGNIVFTYSIGNFATLRCVEQIRNDVCYHHANVKIIASAGGFSYGQLGMSHHATEDIAMMRALPNMRVYVPADPEEAIACLDHAAQTDGPCYIRLARRGEPVLYSKIKEINATRIQPVITGGIAALLACGPILKKVLNAAQILKANHTVVSVYSVPCVKPIDRDAVCEIAGEYSLIVTIEEHEIAGGLGGTVAEVVSELPGLHASVYRLGLRDEYTGEVGSYDYLCGYYGLSGEKIARTVSDMLGKMFDEGCHNRSE